MRTRSAVVIVLVFSAAVVSVLPAGASAGTPINLRAASHRAVSVAAGGSHSCALTAVGGVRCWGSNKFGQLGDGTLTDRLRPVDVVGLTRGVIAVSAGEGHSCAVTSGGAVKCWGWNANGQLGDGTKRSRRTPVNVVGLSRGVADVSAGGDHSCALTLAGGVKCWGANYTGEIGDGTATARFTPADVLGLTSGAAAVSAGAESTCALTVTGGAKCWGSDADGVLGDGAPSDVQYAPVDVIGLDAGVAEISTSTGRACAVTTAGAAVCWGTGPLGDGTANDSATPVDVVGLGTNVSRVSVGGSINCALLTSGAVSCWGSSVGDGTPTHRPSPVKVIGLSNVTAISAGDLHACAVTASGAARCWDYNSSGQIGDGTRLSRLVPITVSGLTGVPTGTLRPDLMIATPSGANLGNNIYNATGSGQTRRVNLARNHTKTFTLRYETDGNVGDILFLEGPDNARLCELVSGCQVHWTKIQRTQRTTVRVTVSVPSNAKIGHRYLAKVLCRSSHDPGKLDVVKIVITVVR